MTRMPLDMIDKKPFAETAATPQPVTTTQSENHVAIYEAPMSVPPGVRAIRMTLSGDVPIDYDPQTRTCYPVLKQ